MEIKYDIVIRQIILELFNDVISSLKPFKFIISLYSPVTWFVISLGCIGILFHPHSVPSLTRLAVGAMLEEITWRVFIQNQIDKSRSTILFAGISIGCLLSSTLFCILHLFTQSPLMALLTFFPSLLIGILWTRFQSLWLCGFIHFWYNAIFFYL